MRLVLASASPARLSTLRRAGVEPTVVVSGVDENIDETDPPRHALTLASMKATAVAARLSDDEAGPDLVILGCDSILELDGQVHGKPRDGSAATERWHQMRGRSGVLHTGHCLLHPSSGGSAAAVASTTVHFADVSDEEVEAYVATGEPLQVAGAFTVDGLGGAFVERIEGDHHNVVGLSLPLLRHLLAELGLRWIDLWTSPAPVRDA